MTASSRKSLGFEHTSSLHEATGSVLQLKNIHPLLEPIELDQKRSFCISLFHQLALEPMQFPMEEPFLESGHPNVISRRIGLKNKGFRR